MAKRGSLKWRENISKGRQANYSPGPRYWLGKKHTEEYKKNMSKSLSGKNNPRYGVKLDKDFKNRIRKSVKEFYKKNGTSHLKKPKKNHSATYKSGSKHWNWKGGITSLNRRIRSTHKYKTWRRKIYERDHFTCQICKQKGDKLNADHIKPLSQIVFENNIWTVKQALKCDELWLIKNGRTTCIRCHKTTDTYGGKSKQI